MPRYDRSVTLTDAAGNAINVGNPLPTSGGGGGGGGAVTVADGADVCEGATTDVAVTGDNPGTVSAKLRGINKILADVWDSVNHAFKVNLVSGSAGQADNSTFTEGTTSFTPVGGEYNTVPGDVTDGRAAAAQITKKRGIHVNLRDSLGVESGTAGNPVRTDPTGSTTQPVSASSLPLPTGASTETTLAALNTVTGATTDAAVTSDTTGTISAKLRGLVKILASVWDSVNGRLKVDGSGVTQPVSGTVTANQGTSPWVVDTELPAATALSDSMSNPTAPAVGALQGDWNDEDNDWHRQRDNTRITLLASASRTVTTDSSSIKSYNYRRVAIMVNVTANTGGIKQIPSLQIQDSVSGSWDTVWLGPAITGQGIFTYLFGDGATGGGGSQWSAILGFGIPGAVWRFEMVAGNTNPCTYSVSAHQMV